MKYRQWKKNYKKRHGVNPPATIDKRKQRKIAKKAIKAIGAIDWDKIGRGFDSAGTACKNIADNMQPQEIRGCMLSREVKGVVCDYGVYENDALTGESQLKLITNSRRAAGKIVEIMQQDQLEHFRLNYPERVQRRTDAADAILYGLRATKIYCDEGAFENA